MTRIDQFESVFRSADKAVFRHEPIAIAKVLVVTDLDERGAAALGAELRTYLEVIRRGEDTIWREVTGDEFSSVGELLTLVEEEAPDLICTYRNLHGGAWMWPHSLGSHLDILTQATDVPVLLLPHPKAQEASLPANTSSVVAMTDHLAGDSHLVSVAAGLTVKGGRLHLTHVEDRGIFERYLDVIGKIPAIDTDTAREELRAQLLKEPTEYVASCKRSLADAGLSLEVEPHVVLGHHLEEHLAIVAAHEADLLVLNTKDDEQLAMHGLAWPIAVELRTIPLLML
jgi:nucleotide-binding universal stress UspA family protein